MALQREARKDLEGGQPVARVGVADEGDLHVALSVAARRPGRERRVDPAAVAVRVGPVRSRHHRVGHHPARRDPAGTARSRGRSQTRRDRRGVGSGVVWGSPIPGVASRTAGSANDTSSVDAGWDGIDPSPAGSSTPVTSPSAHSRARLSSMSVASASAASSRSCDSNSWAPPRNDSTSMPATANRNVGRSAWNLGEKRRHPRPVGVASPARWSARRSRSTRPGFARPARRPEHDQRPVPEVDRVRRVAEMLDRRKRNRRVGRHGHPPPRRSPAPFQEPARWRRRPGTASRPRIRGRPP